jgi:hypothetical protein
MFYIPPKAEKQRILKQCERTPSAAVWHENKIENTLFKNQVFVFLRGSIADDITTGFRWNVLPSSVSRSQRIKAAP